MDDPTFLHKQALNQLQQRQKAKTSAPAYDSRIASYQEEINSELTVFSRQISEAVKAQGLFIESFQQMMETRNQLLKAQIRRAMRAAVIGLMVASTAALLSLVSFMF